MSTNEGRNFVNPNLYDDFYMFGSRGFSIFRVSDFSLVYDSGDEVERMHAVYYPEVFNGNTKPDDSSVETPEDLMDKRSDNQVCYNSVFIKFFISFCISQGDSNGSTVRSCFPLGKMSLSKIESFCVI